MQTEELVGLVRDATGATSIDRWIPIQTLWSGYGQIWRVHLNGSEVPSVVVKQIHPPRRAEQPRGWNTNQSHQRKLHSYDVESNWYRDWSHKLGTFCRVPKCHAVQTFSGGNHCFVLEDLDASGFGLRVQHLIGDGTRNDNGSGSTFLKSESNHIRLGLEWLARFHVFFLGTNPEGLWTTGTYWHLATRPEEWEAMSDQNPLKMNAAEIDDRLRNCRFPTIVHGDAKIANFCIAEDGLTLAAVDFQYVGGGCGMKDVAYFLGSCLSELALQRDGERWLEYYLDIAKKLMETRHPDVCLDAFETDARKMYPLAWADFQRFLTGWYPSHAKLHGYSRQMTQEALRLMDVSSNETPNGLD